MNTTNVIIEKVDSFPKAVERMLRQLGLDQSKFPKKNVFVKPNMYRAALPETHLVTDPELLSATVDYLIDAGAHVIVGDNPVPTKKGNEIDTARVCGYLEAARGCFKNIGADPERIAPGGPVVKDVYISHDALAADFFMSLPKFRAHDLTVMTLAVKNSFGLIPGGLKPYIHSLFPRMEDFSNALIEIYNIRPPDGIIVDCVDIVDARGKKFSPRLLIGGTDGHAVDWVCARIAGINPYTIPTLKRAEEMGLFDEKSVQVQGRMQKIPGFAVPFKFPFRSAIVDFVAQFLYQMWLGRVPVVDSSLCTKCNSCDEVCPVQAMRKQQVDYRRCIKCYCCLESCPSQAIRTKLRLGQ